MNYVRRIVTLAVAIISISAVLVAAKDAPGSPGELAKQLEQAVKAKNKGAALELFCWEGVSKDMRAKQEAAMHVMFVEMDQGLELTSVKAGPLPRDFRAEQVLNGVRYRPNLSVLGVIHVMLAEDTNPTQFMFTYGKKDKAFFLSALVEAKASEKADDKK